MIPPYQPRLNNIVSLPDFYRIYLKEMEGYTNILDYNTFKLVVKDCFFELSTAIIRDKKIFTVPYKMGRIFIKKNRDYSDAPNHNNINWKATKEKNKVIKHINLHSRRLYFKWHWKKSRDVCLFTNQSYYSFRAVDDKRRQLIGRRGLAFWIKKCSTDPTLKDYDTLL
jgi:hypothetical protein